MDMTTRPNVLLICTDHWSGLLTQPGGHPVVMTPTLKQMSQSGVYFANAYSSCPSCIPARRTLMTGVSARNHGNRTNKRWETMPGIKTVAECFNEGGYQSYAVGKLHVHPQRDRIGFHEVMLEEQGRPFSNIGDDYELYLAEKGFPGKEYAGGMIQNDFITRQWHLPEECHPVNWAAGQMCKAIKRRDPRKPGFWYLSFSAPHPPLTPLKTYMDQYRHIEIAKPSIGDWAQVLSELPYPLKVQNIHRSAMVGAPWHEQKLARQAFYATLTHIDHQIRTVIGTLREESLIDNTIVVFTSDHGTMLGEHGLWCMTPMYEMCTKIPILVVPAKGDTRMGIAVRDNRLAEFGDIMPTLLDLAGLPIPETVDGMSLLGQRTRDHLYGQHFENEMAMRMIRHKEYKLIYYPCGNSFQLFDLKDDPKETCNIVNQPQYQDTLETMKNFLRQDLYGGDEQFLKNGTFVGLPEVEFTPPDNRELMGQRGLRFV